MRFECHLPGVCQPATQAAEQLSPVASARDGARPSPPLFRRTAAATRRTLASCRRRAKISHGASSTLPPPPLLPQPPSEAWKCAMHVAGTGRQQGRWARSRPATSAQTGTGARRRRAPPHRRAP
eukprot:6284742-Prymnesium_polylepis.1